MIRGMADVRYVSGTQVNIAYERHGDPGGWPVALVHGFPYDPRCYDDVVDELARAGADVVVPYVRGMAQRAIEPPTPSARDSRRP